MLVRRARAGWPVPVGSGDSVLAGLVAALNAGRSIPDALAQATAAGAANTVQPGAAVFDPRLVAEWVREVAVLSHA